MKLSHRQRRAALLLSHGYHASEVGRRMGVSDGAVYGFALRIYRQICADEQRDGRAIVAIVTVWAARNRENIEALIASERAVQWRELPPAITESRLGVA